MFYEVENMIAGVVGYDSIRKHLAVWLSHGGLEENAIHMDVYIEN